MYGSSKPAAAGSSYYDSSEVNLSSPNSTSYWQSASSYANDSLDSVTQISYTTMSSWFSYMYGYSNHDSPSTNFLPPMSPGPELNAAPSQPESTPVGSLRRRRTPTLYDQRKNLAMMLENPFNSVRGRNVDASSSLVAVRTLLTLVPFKDATMSAYSNHSVLSHRESLGGDDDDDFAPAAIPDPMETSFRGQEDPASSRARSSVSPSETASQIVSSLPFARYSDGRASLHTFGFDTCM
jgi:hypothetical protein